MKQGRSEVAQSSLARVARLVLLLGAAAALLLLVISIRRYGLTVAPGPLGWQLTFASLTAALAWCAFRLSDGARTAVAVVCAASVTVLYAGNVVLEVVDRTQRDSVQRQLTARSGRPHDRRSVSEAVRDLRRSGERAVPSVVPKAILEQWGSKADPRTAWTSPMLPLAGVSNRPTVQLCKEGGFQVYMSDDHGFDNPQETWSRPSHEVVLIGDSFTHGYCVDGEHSYAGLIHQRWPSTINLGIGGNGPLSELGVLTEYAASFRPKVVVWQFFFNDMPDLQKERQNPILMRYLDPEFSQGLMSRQPEIDLAIEPWVDRMYAAGEDVDWLDRFHWRQLLTLYRLRELLRIVFSGADTTVDPFAELDLFRDVLKIARDRVRGWGGHLYFVFVPEWERYYQPQALVGRDVRDAVEKIARELELPVIDFEQQVRDHPERARLFGYQELAKGHFSALGYELMAREVSRAIEKDLQPSGSAR
jgi:hypothetical protein